MTVADVWDDAREVFGSCEESTLYRRLNAAIGLLVDKGDWAPLFTYLDICVSGRCVALPSDVETPIAAIIDGTAALARNELYRYHVNGPGEKYRATRWEWENGGQSCTMRDLIRPTALVAYVDNAADSGSSLLVYGFDKFGKWVRTHQPDGTWIDGYPVPTLAGWALAEAGAPEFSRITGVKKARTVGRVRLSTLDWQPATGEGLLLGDYLPHETEPLYRRIRLPDCPHDVARFYVRRKTFVVANQTDFIPLHQTFALRLAMQAVQAYIDRDAAMGMDFESQATRILTDREAAVTPPAGFEIQYDPGTLRVENLEDF